MNTQVASIALLALSACQAPYEISLPADVVVIDDAITDAEFEAAEQAADEWNERAPGVVTSVSRGKPSDQCSTIYIRRMSADECISRHKFAYVRWDYCHATIDLCANEEAIQPKVLAHELGHALLADHHHSDVVGDIMRTATSFDELMDAGVTEAEGQRALERLGENATR